MVVVQAGR